MGNVMIKIKKEDPRYYQKVGLVYFLCLISIDIFLFSFLFGKFEPHIEFFVEIVLFLISGPVSFIFMGYESIFIALPFMIAPLLLLFFVKTKSLFKVFIVFFLIYWVSLGFFNFNNYINS